MLELLEVINNPFLKIGLCAEVISVQFVSSRRLVRQMYLSVILMLSFILLYFSDGSTSDELWFFIRTSGFHVLKEE